MVYEFATVVLLVVICFLLYQLYRIKYREGSLGDNSLSGTIKKDLMKLEDKDGKVLEMRIKDIDSRISELEKKLEKSNALVEKFVEELS
jgi:hypothetical protein